MFAKNLDGGSEDWKALGAMLGPGHLDQIVRSAIQACWMALPEERRTIDAVEHEIRRLVEPALTHLREDAEAFGITPNA